MAGLLEPGTMAPEVAAQDQHGNLVRLRDLRGRPVVLYFYPADDTPGCTAEACGFRDRISDYTGAGVAVLGISPDSEEDITKFARKFNLNFPLLADEDHAVAEKYGVWQKKSMMGKEYMGVVRTTFIINKDGKIAHVFEKVKPEGHEAEVMQYLRTAGLAQAGQ